MGEGRSPTTGWPTSSGVYFPAQQSVYLVPIDGVARLEGRLRIQPTRNNQKRGVRYAAEFEIGRWSLDSLRNLVLGDSVKEESLATVA